MHLHTVLLMSSGAVKGLQLFVSLSLLIVLHEFGHFFFARVFKTRVEKFYLFFDFLFPFSSVLNFALFKKKKGDTEYGIGWFPLGGYVKIAGMVDESMDKEALKLPPQPWEYRSKKAYQRLFIMLGGIIMNILVAMIIYMFMSGIYGEQKLPAANVKYGVVADSLAQSFGLRNGDIITGIDGKQADYFENIVPNILLDQAKTINITRNGTAMNIDIPSGTIRQVLKKQKGTFIQARIPIVVDSVPPKSEAAKFNFQKNDSIVAVNNMPVGYFDEFEKAKKDNKGKQISVSVIRNNTLVNFNCVVPETGSFGFVPKYPERFLNFTNIKYGFFGAIARGVTRTGEEFVFYIRQFKLLFTKEVKASESLGGIISFGKIFPSEFSMYEFLRLTAFVSIILAFMNLLPIPGLDGGYVIFLLYEMISRRKVSEKVMERATTVGLVLLLALMVYANGLDIMRLFKH